MKLPVLETRIDCADIGYPGLVLVAWLNPTVTDDWRPPEVRQPWDTPYYAGLGRMFLRVEIPAEFSDSGKDEVLPLGSPQAAYELEQSNGFDQSILVWGVSRYRKVRDARFKDELGN